MASAIYNSFNTDVANGDIDLGADTFYIMLVTASYTVDVDNHDRRNDLTNEITGTGYTAGGKALTSVTVTQDNTNNLTKWDAADPSWGSATFTARAAIIYKYTGTGAANDRLCVYLDFGADKTVTAGTFPITINSNGILQIKQGT